MGRKKGRGKESATTPKASKMKVDPAMTGILQSFLGHAVKIGFRTDWMVTDEGTTVYMTGILMMHPSGAKGAYALFRLDDMTNDPATLVGQGNDTLIMASFTAEVVSIVMSAVPKDSVNIEFPEGMGLMAGDPDA